MYAEYECPCALSLYKENINHCFTGDDDGNDDNDGQAEEKPKKKQSHHHQKGNVKTSHVLLSRKQELKSVSSSSDISFFLSPSIKAKAITGNRERSSK